MLGSDAVHAILAEESTSKISEKLRATLQMLRKVTRDHASVTADDMRALLAIGVTRSQIEDALMVGWCFNVITRLADTFEFHVGSQAAFDQSAKMLLSRGYKI